MFFWHELVSQGEGLVSVTIFTFSSSVWPVETLIGGCWRDMFPTIGGMNDSKIVDLVNEVRGSTLVSIESYVTKVLLCRQPN